MQGRADAAAEFFAPSYMVHLTGGDRRGHRMIAGFVKEIREAFADLRVEVEVLASDGDRVAWQRTCRAIHRADFKGFPATGRAIEWRDMLVSRFEDGLIAEEWAVSDLAGPAAARSVSAPDRPRRGDSQRRFSRFRGTKRGLGQIRRGPAPAFPEPEPMPRLPLTHRFVLGVAALASPVLAQAQFEILRSPGLPSSASGASSAALGDVDRDGDLDVVLGFSVGRLQTRLFLNDGNGRFFDLTAERMPTDAEETRDVALVDVDGDGDLDLLLANGVTIYGVGGQNRLYLNNGFGSFIDATAARAAGQPGHDQGVGYR